MLELVPYIIGLMDSPTSRIVSIKKRSGVCVCFLRGSPSISALQFLWPFLFVSALPPPPFATTKLVMQTALSDDGTLFHKARSC